MPFEYHPDPREGKLISTLKVHIEYLCRLMPKSPDIMQCPTTYIVSRYLDESEKFLQENAANTDTWVFKPDANGYGHGLAIVDDIYEAWELAQETKYESTSIARTEGNGSYMYL